MIPSLKRTKLIRAFRRAGFAEIKKGGKNYTLLAKDGHPHILRIPTYKSDVPKGTMHQLIKDAGLTVEEFLQLL